MKKIKLLFLFFLVSLFSPKEIFAQNSIQISGVVVSSSQINLSWSPLTNIKSYEIYRNNEKIATTETTSFGDTGLKTSTSYTYYVKAGLSNNSNTLNLKTQSTSKNGGTISGTVYSSKGGGIAGAKAKITVGNFKKTYVTSVNGFYFIPNLPEGKYNIKFLAKNYSENSEEVIAKNNINVINDIVLSLKK